MPGFEFKQDAEAVARDTNALHPTPDCISDEQADQADSQIQRNSSCFWNKQKERKEVIQHQKRRRGKRNHKHRNNTGGNKRRFEFTEPSGFGDVSNVE